MDVTLTDATNYIQRLTGNVFSTTQVQNALKDAYRVFCRETGVLWTKASPAGLQDVASTATYTLPTDLLQVERLSYLSRTIWPMRSEQLTQMDATALTVEGTVVGYILDGDGPTKIRKYRVPAATDVDSRTSIEYTRQGATLSSGDTGFEVPPWMVRYIECYAISQLLRRDGIAQDLKYADHFRQRYLDGVKRTLQRKSKFLSRRTGVFGGGPSTRTIPIGPRLPWEYGEVVR